MNKTKMPCDDCKLKPECNILKMYQVVIYGYKCLEHESKREELPHKGE